MAGFFSFQLGGVVAGLVFCKGVFISGGTSMRIYFFKEDVGLPISVLRRVFVDVYLDMVTVLLWL